MRRRGTWAIFITAAAAACSNSFADADNYAPGDSSAAGSTGNGSNGGTSAAGAPVVPPEREESQSYRAPVVSGRWVWTANPDTGKVAVVDAKSFSVRLADAGAGPTFLTALPSGANTSRALVINVGSHDATLLQAGPTGPVSALDPVPLQPDANAWAVGKSGKFAIAWSDSQDLQADSSETFQDVSVLDLRGDQPVATRLVVGFVPSRVFIDDDEQRAYVVAKTGITVIDLASRAGPRVLREEPVSQDPLHEDVSTRDVSVMPDGSYALVRHEGSPIITLLELATGTLSSVTLSGPITDLDLVANAQSALAVVRGGALPAPDPSQNNGEAGALNAEGGAPGDAAEGGAAGTASQAGSGGGAGSPPASLTSSLAILPIPGIFSQPNAFDTVSIDEVFGLVNIAPGGTQALLYSNAVQNSHVTLLQTAHGAKYLTYRTVDVRGYVKDVFPSPDGAYAIASLTPRDAQGKPGFAAVPVDSALPARVQTTDAPVFAVAQSEGPHARAIVTVSDGKANFAAYVVRMPELVIDSVKLPSRPLPNATGLVPDAGMAYIAQAHPQGRITFIDLESGQPRTITGFELSAKVSNGQ